MVQAGLGRAAQGLCAFELALSIMCPPEVEQRLPERVVSDTHRHDPGQAELACLRDRVSRLDLRRVRVPRIALQQREQRVGLN